MFERKVVIKNNGGESTTKILSITFLILAFLTIHLVDHGTVNVLISLIVISQLLIKLLHLS
jgi:hypothetical protein